MGCLSLLILLLAALPMTADATLREEHEEHFELAFGAATGRRVVVENLSGGVTVLAADVDRVEVRARRRATAESPQRLAAAQREVSLLRQTSGETVRLRVDAPVRCGCHGHGDCDADDGSAHRGWCESWQDLGYRVTYDLELRVPAQVDLVAATVEDGDLVVRGVRGGVVARNVMGRVEALGVERGGRFTSVNAPVDVRFAANPSAPCVFSTVNGDLRVAFRPGLGADLVLSTLNGEIWTDFPYVIRALPAQTRRESGKYVYRSGHGVGARIGAGGPELRFSTINGKITLEQQ